MQARVVQTPREEGGSSRCSNAKGDWGNCWFECSSGRVRRVNSRLRTEMPKMSRAEPMFCQLVENSDAGLFFASGAGEPAKQHIRKAQNDSAPKGRGE